MSDSYNIIMSTWRLQFRLTNLFVATTLVATIVTSVAYLPSTYETDGALGPGGYAILLLSFFAIAGLIYIFSRRFRTSAIIAVIVVCSAFSYRQLVLTRRLHLLEAEVPLIIAYVEEFHNENGQFPRDLSGYVFRQPGLQEYISYSPLDTIRPPWNSATSPLPPYQIQYHPTHAYGIGHWYTPTDGYWYEDD